MVSKSLEPPSTAGLPNGHPNAGSARLEDSVRPLAPTSVLPAGAFKTSLTDLPD
jgi:hypothetical protein